MSQYGTSLPIMSTGREQPYLAPFYSTIRIYFKGNKRNMKVIKLNWSQHYQYTEIWQRTRW